MRQERNVPVWPVLLGACCEECVTTLRGVLISKNSVAAACIKRRELMQHFSCAIQGYMLEMSQILVSFEFLIHSTRASCNVRNPFNVVRFSLHGSEYTHPATCRSPPLPPKNAPNTQTEAHIKTRIMLTLNTPINQCECFLIMTVFQRWGKWISYICMQICC